MSDLQLNGVSGSSFHDIQFKTSSIDVDAMRKGLSQVTDDQRRAASITVGADHAVISPEARQKLEASGNTANLDEKGLKPLDPQSSPEAAALYGKIQDASARIQTQLREHEERVAKRAEMQFQNAYDRAGIVREDKSGAMSTLTSQGTTVRLDPAAEEGGTPSLNFTGVTGGQISLALNPAEDLHIKETADGLAVRNLTTGTAQLMNYDGSVSDMDDLSLFGDLSGDDILVNMTQTDVDGGDGNDTVINFADNARIRGGNGNDTLLAGNPEATGLDVDMGEGNDTVKAQTLRNSTVSLGNGDNRLEADMVRDSHVSADEGNSAMDVNLVYGSSTLSMGNGNNKADIGAVVDGGSVTFGDGNNRLTTNAILGSSVSMGNGNNTLKVTDTGNDAHDPLKEGWVRSRGNVTMGNGNNTVSADTLRGLEMRLGEGNNALTAQNIRSTDLYTGNGNNTVTADTASARLHLGNGNNAVSADTLNGSVSTGDGNNTVTAAKSHTLATDFGNGNNTVRVDAQDTRPHDPRDLITASSMGIQINAKNGNNVFQLGDEAKDFRDRAMATMNVGHGNNQISGAHTVTAGDGDNVITGASRVTAGDGDNTVTTHNASGNVNMRFGNGNNTVVANSNVGRIDLDFGDGSNTIDAGGLHGGTLNAGDGDNTMKLGFGMNAALGNGNNAVRMGIGSNLQAGDGNNIVTGDLVTGNLRVGDGNNSINIRYMDGKLQMGHGNNTVNMELLTGSAQFGKGSNTVGIRGTAEGSLISFGNQDYEAYTTVNMNSLADTLGPMRKVSDLRTSFFTTKYMGNNHFVVEDTLPTLDSKA